MQRVRIGLTGLACVFLLVLLGAIFVKFVHDGEVARAPEPQLANDASQSDNAANAADAAAPKEPLAELGIAPGNVPQQPVVLARPPAAPPDSH